MDGGGSTSNDKIPCISPHFHWSKCYLAGIRISRRSEITENVSDRGILFSGYFAICHEREGKLSQPKFAPRKVRQEEECRVGMPSPVWPVVEDTDQLDYCLECFCYAAIGGGGQEIPGCAKDDFGDDVGGEIVTCVGSTNGVSN